MSHLTVFLRRVSYKNFTKWEKEIERTPDYGCMDGHIDDAETENNYHIIYPKGTYRDLASPYVTTGHKGKMNNAYMMSSIVTADHLFFEKRSDICIRAFFEDAAQFFIDRYSMRCVFSAVVHVDEGDPHMHVCFFPYDTEGNLMDIAQNNREALREFHDDIYEVVGKRWNLEKPDRSEGVEHLTHEEYLQARLMYRYQQEVIGVTNQIEAKRDELSDIEDRIEAADRKERELTWSVRDLQMAQDSMKQENKRIMAQVLEYTDYFAGMQMACAADNPARSKDESIRILKARNYAMAQQIHAGQRDKEDTLKRLKEAEDKLRSAAEQYKTDALVAARLRALDPDLYLSLLRGTAQAPDKAKGTEEENKERAKTA